MAEEHELELLLDYDGADFLVARVQSNILEQVLLSPRPLWVLLSFLAAIHLLILSVIYVRIEPYHFIPAVEHVVIEGAQCRPLMYYQVSHTQDPQPE